MSVLEVGNVLTDRVSQYIYRYGFVKLVTEQVSHFYGSVQVQYSMLQHRPYVALRNKECAANKRNMYWAQELSDTFTQIYGAVFFTVYFEPSYAVLRQASQ